MVMRSVGDLVLASNMARDLSNLVVSYLELYKKYAQGINGVTIPNEEYEVVFLPIKDEDNLKVKLVFSRTVSWETPTYYDVDDDNFCEIWGSSNVSGSFIKSMLTIEENCFSIPVSHLLLSYEEMDKLLSDFAQRQKALIKENEIQIKISDHQRAIQKLLSESIVK